MQKRLATARARSVAEHDFPKLADVASQTLTIKDNAPLIYHPGKEGGEDLLTRTRAAFGDYRQSMQEDRRVLIDRYELKDIAMKVVGVGSVGTFCAVMLLMASEQDPLFLQVKEARASVLEAYAGKSIYANHGQRVVNGYRLMQSASDIFLGWTEGKLGRYFYMRQLKDMKLAPLVELFSPVMMTQYAEICGWALHALTPAPASPRRSAGTWARATPSTRQLQSSASPTRIRMSATTEVLRKAVRSGRVEVVMEQD